MALKRPEGVRFWHWSDVTRLIAANVPLAKLQSDGHKSDKDAARWWKAVQDTEGYRDMNTRELAGVLFDGLKPTRLIDVTEELQQRHGYWEDEGCTTENHVEVDAQIEAELASFFHWAKSGVPHG